MKFLYFVRVFVISFEFLSILFFAIFYYFMKSDITLYIEKTTVNVDALKWIVLYPIGITGWMLKDGVGILFPDEKTNKLLHQWSSYWKLKVHFNIGLIYSVSLSVICVYLWLTNNLQSVTGVSIFISCLITISISAFSFYSAKLKLRELLIHAK